MRNFSQCSQQTTGCEKTECFWKSWSLEVLWRMEKKRETFKQQFRGGNIFGWEVKSLIGQCVPSFMATVYHLLPATPIRLMCVKVKTFGKTGKWPQEQKVWCSHVNTETNLKGKLCNPCCKEPRLFVRAMGIQDRWGSGSRHWYICNYIDIQLILKYTNCHTLAETGPKCRWRQRWKMNNLP